MTFVLPHLFHWSPTDRRIDILQEGIKVFAKPTVQDGMRSPYICLGFSPSGAWGLSGDFLQGRGERNEIDQWDLWQVAIPENAQIEVLPEFGPKLQEVKVFTSIPASSMWFVASRDMPVFLEIDSNKPAMI